MIGDIDLATSLSLLGKIVSVKTLFSRYPVHSLPFKFLVLVLSVPSASEETVFFIYQPFLLQLTCSLLYQLYLVEIIMQLAGPSAAKPVLASALFGHARDG